VTDVFRCKGVEGEEVPVDAAEVVDDDRISSGGISIPVRKARRRAPAVALVVEVDSSFETFATVGLVHVVVVCSFGFVDEKVDGMVGDGGIVIQFNASPGEQYYKKEDV
jgi:hypothetical protein